MKPIVVLLAAMACAVLAGLPAPAAADVFLYSSKCKNSSIGGRCSTIGAVNNGSVQGSLTIDPAAISPNGALDVSDLLDFSFTFGTVTITKASAKALRFEATLNAAMSGFTSFTLWTSENVDPTRGDALTIGLDAWSGSLSGFCNNAACDSMVDLGLRSIFVSNVLTPGFGVAAFTRQASVAVSEPMTAALLGAGLLALGATRRCRGHAT